jgi:exonuclease III
MVTNISSLPSGRTVSPSFGEMHVVNIYSPSGTSKQRERETFFNTDLPYLLEMASEDLLLGGDFKCVMDAGDSTGHGFTAST